MNITNMCFTVLVIQHLPDDGNHVIQLVVFHQHDHHQYVLFSDHHSVSYTTPDDGDHVIQLVVFYKYDHHQYVLFSDHHHVSYTTPDDGDHVIQLVVLHDLLGVVNNRAHVHSNHHLGAGL